jgi:hypothetical protein
MATGDDPTGGEGRPAYPPDLTALVLRRWADVQRGCGGHLPRPSRQRLEHALSASFQASLLRDEGRSITFRIALASPRLFVPAAGPPTGLHRLVFDQRRPFDHHELRLLSPAAAFSRSFIGASLDGRVGPHLWGLIHTGPDWFQAVRGGRGTRQAVPNVPTIAVTGPGRVLVNAGSTVIADLSNGTLIGGGLDVFEAPWMECVLSPLGATPRATHASDPRGPARTVDPAFRPKLARQALRRVLAGIGGAHHGGMLLIVPERRVSRLVTDGGLIQVKYRFADEEPRRRLLTLSTRIMDELGRLAVSSGGALPGWTEYSQSDLAPIKELDAAVFEVAHLVSDLARVDGAIVMTDRWDLIGFGGEIAGNLPEVSHVAHATDLDGRRRERVRADRVGTRHRSAYRLCHEVHDVLAMVVSQDGGLRFIRWHAGAVTYWDQMASGPWDPS